MVRNATAVAGADPHKALVRIAGMASEPVDRRAGFV